ncbi:MULTISPECIES: DnaJ domain-containing protein [Halostella]|uniref:DnaJ domain-containing protein n=1 Tax=Halostella TaxID=1843185 RepID=UPI000EF7A360|nr:MULTISPECIES: J domain-containing protein [Halostella]
MADTYYDVLGVPPDADQDAVRAAYREKVKETHPDVSDDPDASERFKRVTRAEEVLGDEDERARYDRLGHDAYVDRVSGRNAAGSERSPWTTDERRDPSEAARQHVSGDDGGAAGSGRTSRDRTSADDWGSDGVEWGRDGKWGRDRDERESTAARDGTGRSRAQRRQEFYRDRTGREETSYAVHGWDDEGGADGRDAGVPLTQQHLMFLAGMVFLYPVLAFFSVTPAFPLVLRLVVGLCTLLITGYLLTIPPIGTAIFGVWSVLSPIAVLLLPVDPLSLPALFALGVCWVPFGYSLVVARALRG